MHDAVYMLGCTFNGSRIPRGCYVVIVKLCSCFVNVGNAEMHVCDNEEFHLYSRDGFGFYLRISVL